MERKLLILMAIVLLALTTPATAGIRIPPANPSYVYEGKSVEGVWQETAIDGDLQKPPEDPDSTYKSGNKILYMDNCAVTGNKKTIWLHMTFTVGSGSNWSTKKVYAELMDVPENKIISHQTDYLMSGGSYNFLEIWQQWSLDFQPNNESIYLGKLFNDDTKLTLKSMECRTFCVPEPSCLMLLAAGMLFLKRRKA